MQGCLYRFHVGLGDIFACETTQDYAKKGVLRDAVCVDKDQSPHTNIERGLEHLALC